MVKEKILKYMKLKHNTEVLNTHDYGNYFIVEYVKTIDKEATVNFQGFLVNGDDFKPLLAVYPTLDMCLIECICCKYEKCSMSHATEYIFSMLGI